MSRFYHPVVLAPIALAGEPIPLPPDFVGLTDAVLANFSASMSPPPVGYAGKGLWPLVASAPAFDRATETVTGQIDLASRKPDKATRTVTAVYGTRPLTADEIAALNPVPEKVTNFQARSIMLRTPYGDGTMSVFTRVDADLRAAIEATKEMPDLDPRKVDVATQWQAWEQANDYFRNGGVTQLLAARYDVSAEAADDLFRQASKVDA